MLDGAAGFLRGGHGMQRCSEFAYAMCPDRYICGSREDAVYMEGSECARFNEDHEICVDGNNRENLND